MTLVFYISGHGFGHASRQVEIIRALAARQPEHRIVIRSAVSPDLLERTLDVPFQLLPGPCDTGIVQRTSIEHDDEATVREAMRFYERYDVMVRAEVDRAGAESPALIVGDIAPVAFEVGARLGVPAVAIANFTWDWIYDTHPGMADQAAWIAPLIRQSYQKATHALELPFSGGFEVFPSRERIPLVARRSHANRTDAREYFNLRPRARVALLSFGGYGLPQQNLATLDCTGEWTIVTTDRLARSNGGGGGRGEGQSHNVVRIDERRLAASPYRYEDLVAAADVVITKPGYGILAECISTGTAMLYTSRGVFREYDVLVREMPRYLRARFISQGDLLAGRWRDSFNALIAQPRAPETMPTNGAEVAAEKLSGWIE
jgi:L-arabinokinase